MDILVTGGTGFIGTHLVAALVARGWRVRCLVRATSNRTPLAAQKVEYVVGSLQDRRALARAVQGVPLIFHLAGATKVAHPADYERMNYSGTQHLLEACMTSGSTLQKFLYISSIAAAGPSPTGVPMTESALPQPVGPYGRSKLRAEEAVLACRHRLPVMVLRPSAIYGPRDTDFFQLFQALRYGVLPHIGRQELHIDLCFVTDLVHGMIAAAESQQGLGEIFFLGGTHHTWRELGQEIARLLHIQPREIVMPRMAVLTAARLVDGWARLRGQPSLLSRANVLERLQSYWLCDSSKAYRTFGYRPQTPLAQGLAATLQWYQDAGWL
jgi:nucleoside-diphosphate-sugar epimerase